jgi:hypothetical protein
LIREALDAYLTDERVDIESALEATLGAAPGFEVPSRGEWDEAELIAACRASG